MKPKSTSKGKKEFRYQFLGYEEVGTGKFMKSPLFGLGLPLAGSGVKMPESTTMIEIKKTVAMVFDKQTGEVKQTEIKKL